MNLGPWISAIVIGAVVLPTAARAGAASGDLSVLYHADLDGRFAAPACGRAIAGLPGYAALAAALATDRSGAENDGGPGPLVLLGGNTVGPALFTRSLLDGNSAGGIATIADVLARGGYDAVALGHHELSLEPAVLDPLLQALGKRGLPIVATNLECDARRRRTCDSVRRDLIVERGGVRVGIVATIAPSVLPAIPAGRIDGITIEEPAPAIRAAVHRLRARGATVVLLMTQGLRDTSAVERIESLARQLGAGPGDAPDVILAGGLFDEETGQALRLLERDNAPPIVGARSGVGGLTRVSIPLATILEPRAQARTSSIRAELVAIPTAPVDDATVAALARPVAAFCARYGLALTAALGGRPVTREGFTTFVLDVMRREARAEIALINRGAVRRTPFPVVSALTRADLHDALPYPTIIGVARLTGPSVEAVVGPALGNPKARLLGLRRTANGLEVNGRPLDKARSYEVATIRFVSDGGDSILPARALDWKALPGSPDLRDRVETRVRDGDAGTAHSPSPQPEDPAIMFSPPRTERLLLVGLTDMGIDLSNTTIRNPRAYADTQLARNQQTSFKGDATAILQVRLPRHQNDTRLNLKYGWARNETPSPTATGGPTGVVSGETVDLATFTSTYSYGGLHEARRIPRAAIPDPYGRLWVESELTRPPLSPTQTRAYHHFQAQATAGALFTLVPQLKARAGVGGRRELLAGGDAGRWQMVAEAGATLDPTAIASLGPLAVKLEGLVDYVFIDPAGIRDHQLRGSAKVSIPLLPLLFVTAGADVFAVERGRQGWGASYDSTLGLRLHLDAAYQRL